MLHFQLAPEVTPKPHANWITRAASAITPIAKNLAAFARCAHTKFSQERSPRHWFKTASGETGGNIADFVFKRTRFSGLREAALEGSMVKTIEHGQTAVALGANDDYFMLMSKLVGAGKVIRIETSPQNCESLRRNIALNSVFNVKVAVMSDRLLPILGADVGRVSFIKIDIERAERRPALEDIIASPE
jgi:hypothetical protein